MEPFLRADQFARVYDILQQEPRIHTKERERERLFLEAVFWMCRSGAQWRFLPAAYGAWNSVYKRFARWDDLGVWARLFDHVADDPDLQSVILDATVVRAHACSAGAPKKTAIRRRKAYFYSCTSTFVLLSLVRRVGGEGASVLCAPSLDDPSATVELLLVA